MNNDLMTASCARQGVREYNEPENKIESDYNRHLVQQ